MSVQLSTGNRGNIHALADYRERQHTINQSTTDALARANAHLTQTDTHLVNIDKNLEEIENARKLQGKSETQDRKSLFQRIRTAVYNAFMALINMTTNFGKQVVGFCKNRFSSKASEVSVSQAPKDKTLN